MLRRIIAAFLLAVPTGAAFGQTDAAMGDWALAPMPNGCMVQATSPKGTMLSIWGFAGEDKLAFLLQNRGWDSLRDGASYDLNLDFVGVRTLPVEATARLNIDSDGPGFYFTMEPGGTSGKGFIEAFTRATGMSIRQDGESVDTLPLDGGHGAMAALAYCLADRWSEDSSAAEGTEEATPAAGTSI